MLISNLHPDQIDHHSFPVGIEADFWELEMYFSFDNLLGVREDYSLEKMCCLVFRLIMNTSNLYL